MSDPRSLEQIESRLAELRENPSSLDGPLDYDDVEYLHCLVRKMELGVPLTDSQWLLEFAEKLSNTLNRNERLLTALKDAIRRPMGVVPTTAEEFMKEIC